MRAQTPRRTLHGGVVLAQGLWFAAGVAPSRVLRQRVLAAWEPGAQVFERNGSYVVRFHEARPVSAGLSLAAPLTLQGSTLISAPLRSLERAGHPDHAWLILIEGGLPRAFESDDWGTVDLATWLDLSEFELIQAAPFAALGDPPPKLAPTPDPQSEMAQRLARTDEQRLQQSELVEALSKVDAPRSSGILPAMLRGLLGVLRFLFLERGRAAAPTPSAPTASKPNLFQRLQAALARWVASTRLMQLLARKQAEYLRTLLDALDAQDDLEILRRAIPLSDGTEVGPSRPALSAPRPRTSFRIPLFKQTRATSIGLGATFFNDLRRAYEAVLERLTRAGKHEEAAFLLAEILKEPARAVDYLERQGQLRLAAQLAESRALAPGLVVRQWFLAGEHTRAVAIAVREGAFDDAILRLERSGKLAEAAALRFLHADRLASAGRWLAAARLVHARTDGAPFALRWLELLRNAGDVQGLALELSLAADRFQVVHAALEPLLGENTPQAITLRALLADEFRRLNVRVGAPLARELTREILADAEALGDPSLHATGSKVADWLGGVFRADFPKEVSAAAEPVPRKPYTLRSPEHDVGTRPIFDVAECASRFVVALGEAGVLVLNRDGKRAAHFDTPAERLVVSDDGTRLLALAQRDRAWRVSQIDLATRRSRAWGELRLDAFAPTFDGETWVIARVGVSPEDDSELLVLDVFDDSPSVLRRVPLPCAINTRLAIQIDPRHCNVLGADPGGGLEVLRLRYELPSWTLRERKQVHADTEFAGRVFLGSFAAAGSAPLVICMRWGAIADGTHQGISIRREHTRIELPIDEDESPTERHEFQVTDGAFAASLFDERGTVRIVLGSFSSNQVQSIVELEATPNAAVRLTRQHALIGDAAGRLLVLDLDTGRCVHDLRL